ncbi:hypothetical protein B0H17DRAFT_1143028 [Mycena rosella]|uniref:Uncharacterized protein n=1 Tax=Mycena rosella TaxID=1033263 RepID=A0AAD7CW11_MYCRO|nr:hypothetical protein B0H17DRAFT_1143028 [Mycena rosella]
MASPIYVSKKTNPGSFNVGDIVEIGFASVAFKQPVRGEEDKHICKLVVRTLTLLDDSIAKHTNNPVANKHFDFPDASSDDEDYPETRKRMAMLQVNDTQEDPDKDRTDHLKNWNDEVYDKGWLQLTHLECVVFDEGSPAVIHRIDGGDEVEGKSEKQM